MTAILSVLAPIPITGAMLTSSTVPETDYALYNPATTYGIADADRVISTVTHRIYQSVRAANIGHDPTDIANQSGATPWWQDMGPTNRFSMFDEEINTQTEVTSPLTMVLSPGGFNAVYLAALDAEALSITVKDAPGGAVVGQFNSSLEASMPGDYDEYFFSPFQPMTDYLISDIDQYVSAEITVTLTRSSGKVKCGALVLGDLKRLGKTLRGVKVKPKTNSIIKTDDFGKTTIKRRKAATDMTVSALLDMSEANNVLATVTGLLDVPAVWIGSGLPELGFMRCYGLGSADISDAHPQHASLTISVQGLI